MEETLEKRHPWVNKKLSEITLPRGSLVVMVKRENESMIPNGDTLLQRGDVLVMSAAVSQKTVSKADS